jgi:hypothetical protein
MTGEPLAGQWITTFILYVDIDLPSDSIDMLHAARRLSSACNPLVAIQLGIQPEHLTRIQLSNLPESWRLHVEVTEANGNIGGPMGTVLD